MRWIRGPVCLSTMLQLPRRRLSAAVSPLSTTSDKKVDRGCKQGRVHRCRQHHAPFLGRGGVPALFPADV